MKTLSNGEFFGQTNETISLDGLIITDTEYTHSFVDWHYHENPYFTFLLQGNMTEGNKKETYDCSAGTLLYHHWEDAHYNIKQIFSPVDFILKLQKIGSKNFNFQKTKLKEVLILKILLQNY